MNKRLYCFCLSCKEPISTNNLNKHFERCESTGGKFKINISNIGRIDFSCRFCERDFNSKTSVIAHETFCLLNLDRKSPSRGMLGKSHPIRGETKDTKDSLRMQGITLKNNIASGAYIPHKTPHTEETKDHLSLMACKRLQKNSKYSKNTEYLPGIFLESSYEVLLATILDELKIGWIKCRQGFIWNDNGKQRRYIPDFYLPTYGVYLDPKNDYLIKKDEIKIESASIINSIKVIILSKEQLNIEYIINMLGKISKV